MCLVDSRFIYFFIKKKVGEKDQLDLFYLDMIIVAPTHWESYNMGLNGGNHMHLLKFERIIACLSSIKTSVRPKTVSTNRIKNSHFKS